MKTYRIAGVKFKIEYLHPMFFDKNIDQYEIHDNSPIDYTFLSSVHDNIEIPQLNFRATLNPNTKIANDSFTTYILIADRNQKPMALIKHDKSSSCVHYFYQPNNIKKFAEMEYTLQGLMFMDIMQSKHFLPIHASAIAYQDQAILFSAPSQTGKSTQTRFWKERYPHVSIINDDKPLLEFQHHEIYVHGSPYSGKGIQNIKTHVKLKAIIFLKQSNNNSIKELSIEEKITKLINNIHRPIDEKTWDHVLKQIEYLVEHTIIIELEAKLDPETVSLVHDYLFPEECHEN